MRTTTADLFPRRYYVLPLGTEFALISENSEAKHD